MDLTSWLLTAAERGNPDTRLDERHGGGRAWSDGNLVRPLVHGASYFAELYARIEEMGAGDLVHFTDWRGDADERLTGEPGSEVSAVLRRALDRGVDVRGLLWRSHSDVEELSHEENRELGRRLDVRGGHVLLDMRVPARGSHHQKLVVLRHANDPTRDVAYVGGIDLCRSRRDDARHLGDPQAQPMSEHYGDTPPWHDVQCAISGPAVYDVETVFRERWEDPSPLTRSRSRHRSDREHVDVHAVPLPPQAPPPPAVPGGTHTVQLLRTYARRRVLDSYPYARKGERSVARGYGKAFEKARRLIYVEDQYLWSRAIADSFVECLERQDDLHMIVVLPRYTDSDNPISRRPQHLGRMRAMMRLAEAAPGRVAFYSPENEVGTPVYVHAKVCVVDDLWCTIGSDNFNRRSWTHDSELSAVVVDSSGDDHSPYARRLRLELLGEHLGFDAETAERTLSDPSAVFDVVAESAAALQEWHEGGRVGPRPAGRLRPLDAPVLSRAEQIVAWPAYQSLHDPDGRPLRMRVRGRY